MKPAWMYSRLDRHIDSKDSLKVKFSNKDVGTNFIID